jgi:hypothetical protein
MDDLNNFWMAHKPTTMSEVSQLHEELQLRLDEATRVGYGFVLPETERGCRTDCPEIAPK